MTSSRCGPDRPRRSPHPLVVLFVAALLTAAFPPHGHATEAPPRNQGGPGPVTSQPLPLSIGETFTLESQVLDETRRINVYLPPGYAESITDGRRYPVLYMPDGGIREDFLHIAGLVQIGTINWTMRPFVLVGIENTERQRDLTGPTELEKDREIAPRVGGSAAFREFLRGELKPHIEATYRTTDESAIIGESLAGLFVVETYLLEPTLFDTYIAVDPSLWWNGEFLVKNAAELVKKHPRGQRGKKTVYLAHGSQEEIAVLTERLGDVLRETKRPIQLHAAAFPDETHMTIYHPAALTAFRSLFPREDEGAAE